MWASIWDEPTGESHERESVGPVCGQFGASVRSTWSMWRRAISLVALCGAHVGVPFESVEYFSRGAAIYDSIEGGAPFVNPMSSHRTNSSLYPLATFFSAPSGFEERKTAMISVGSTGAGLGLHGKSILSFAGTRHQTPISNETIASDGLFIGILDLELSTTCSTM